MRYYSILLISILISTGCSEEAQPPQQEKLQDLLVTVRRHKYLFFKGLARVGYFGNNMRTVRPYRFMLTRVLTSV